MMDAATFERLTGRAPIQDDLERVNCRKICCEGHHHCGWNLTFNRPSFERHRSGDVIICGEDYVDANTVPDVLEFETVQDATNAWGTLENKARQYLKFGTRIRTTDSNKNYVMEFNGIDYFWKEVPREN